MADKFAIFFEDFEIIFQFILLFSLSRAFGILSFQRGGNKNNEKLFYLHPDGDSNLQITTFCYILTMRSGECANMENTEEKDGYSGRKIAPTTGANAPKFFTLATKS